MGAMQPSRRRGFLLFAISAIVFVAVDLGSKSAVFAWLGYPEREPFVLVPGWLQLITRLNNGGIWSLGAQHGDLANSVLIVFGCAATLMISLWAYFGLQRGEKLFPILLGAILAGAIGNLHDRIVHDGVRDFIEFHYYDLWYYPTFNVADSCLIVGAICLILSSFWNPTKGQDPPPFPSS